MGRLITGTRILHRALSPTVDVDLFTDANSDGGTDLRLVCDRPEKSHHLPRDRGRHDDLGLACRHEPTIAGNRAGPALSRRSRGQSVEVPRAGRAACG